jgi:flavin-dependent dehydrogenase
MLSPSALPTLEALSLTDVMQEPSIALPCAGIRRRWGRSPVEFDDFLLHPGSLGFVVDRAAFDQRLRELAVEAGVTILEGRVMSAVSTAGLINLRIGTNRGETIIGTEIAVDATGRPSALARRLGAQQLVAEHLVANRLRRSFSERGISASFYVESHEANWHYDVSGPGGKAERWIVLRGDDRTRDFGEIHINASSAFLSQAGGNGWLAIGDAAMSFDPITSQGLVNALATARVAAGAILASGMVNRATARVYSQSVIDTFMNSERGRMAVYGAILA